jgi:hypothetical protein
MASATTTITTTTTEDPEKLKKVMDVLEKQGETDVKNLSTTSLPVEQTLMGLLQKGANEFEQQMGRKMTYGEMREMYG